MNKKMATIEDLPNEILSKIFSYISIVERQRLERVCKRWQSNIERMWCTIRKLVLKFDDHSNPKNKHQCIIDKFEFVSRYIPSLATILKKCNGNLKGLSLYLRIADWVKSKDICELIQQNTQLESVRMKFYKHEMYEELLRYLPTEHLQHLIIEHPYEEHESPMLFHAIEHVLRKANALTFIYICGISSPSSSILRIISEMNTVKSLHLDYFKDSPIISTITKLSNLEVISISSRGALNDQFVIKLAENCRKLRAIEFKGLLPVTHIGLNAIASLPDLRSLRLELPQNTRVMNYFSNLEEIYCTMCHRPEDEIIMFLQRSPDLKRCYLWSDDSNPHVTAQINQRFEKIATNAGYNIQVSIIDSVTSLLESEWNEKFNSA